MQADCVRTPRNAQDAIADRKGDLFDAIFASEINVPPSGEARSLRAQGHKMAAKGPHRLAQMMRGRHAPRGGQFIQTRLGKSIVEPGPERIGVGQAGCDVRRILEPFRELFRELMEELTLHRYAALRSESQSGRVFAPQPAPPPIAIDAGAFELADGDQEVCHCSTIIFGCE